MNVLRLAGGIAIVLIVTCGCVTERGPVSSVGSKREFCLRVASAQDHQPLPEATVSVVSRDGALRIVGTTDDLGSVCFPKEELDHAILLLVCHPAHFCGALRVGDKHELTLSYDEMYIELAVFAML